MISLYLQVQHLLHGVLKIYNFNEMNDFYTP
jgi:hypothetical protein